jgi:hypothetical protein
MITFILYSTFIHFYSQRPLSISSLLVAKREKPLWDEPRFELGPAIQQDRTLPT